MAVRCEGLVGDDRCLEAGTHFLVNRDHGPDGDDRLLAALERDCLDDPILQVQVAGWFCGEHAGHILGHYPVMKEITIEALMPALDVAALGPLAPPARKSDEEGDEFE